MTTTDIVNSWFRDRIASGAVARDTEAYNQVHAALPDLIGRLAPAADAESAPANHSAPIVDAAAGKSKGTASA